MVTRHAAAPLHLLVALMVVTGLLAAAPTACWCPADDHVGQIIHSRFAHEHASDHDVAAFGEGADQDAEIVDTPAWSSAAGFGPSQWQAGIQVLPPLLASLRLEAGAVRLAFDAARPYEHLAEPSFPPPR